jgi:hypothetical protein
MCKALDSILNITKKMFILVTLIFLVEEEMSAGHLYSVIREHDLLRITWLVSPLLNSGLSASVLSSEVLPQRH